MSPPKLGVKGAKRAASLRVSSRWLSGTKQAACTRCVRPAESARVWSVCERVREAQCAVHRVEGELALRSLVIWQRLQKPPVLRGQRAQVCSCACWWPATGHVSGSETNKHGCSPFRTSPAVPCHHVWVNPHANWQSRDIPCAPWGHPLRIAGPRAAHVDRRRTSRTCIINRFAAGRHPAAVVVRSSHALLLSSPVVVHLRTVVQHAPRGTLGTAVSCGGL